jgi:hypothetical protein
MLADCLVDFEEVVTLDADYPGDWFAAFVASREFLLCT